MDMFFEPFQMVRQLSSFEILLRLGLSLLVGGIMGVERGIKNKSAGLRTYMLVCLGATVVMMTNQYIHQVYGAGDPVRMGAQVISGIGFLGAGTIMVTAKNQIRGLTTAASLWAVATNGLAIGVGAYELAILGGLGLFLTMEAVHGLDRLVKRKSRVVEIYVEAKRAIRIEKILQYLKTRNIQVAHVEYLTESSHPERLQSLVLTIPVSAYYTIEDIIGILSSMDGIYYVERL